MKPLAGKRIVVTRAAGQAAELAEPLLGAGADVLVCPLIQFLPAPDSASLVAAVAELETYDWLVFTSVNGVEWFMERLRRASRRPPPHLRCACVGPGTAEAARRHGFAPEVIPAEFVGDALPDALGAVADLRGSRILLPRAAGAREVLPVTLRQRGAFVSDVEVYRTTLDEAGAQALREALKKGVDVLTFTAGSVITYFVQAVGQPGSAAIAVIGPVTAEAARKHGLRVTIEANPHTVAGLVHAITAYFAAPRGS